MVHVHSNHLFGHVRIPSDFSPGQPGSCLRVGRCKAVRLMRCTRISSQTRPIKYVSADTPSVISPRAAFLIERLPHYVHSIAFELFDVRLMFWSLSWQARNSIKRGLEFLVNSSRRTHEFREENLSPSCRHHR